MRPLPLSRRSKHFIGLTGVLLHCLRTISAGFGTRGSPCSVNSGIARPPVEQNGLPIVLDGVEPLYSTGPAQNQSRTSELRLLEWLELSRCPRMPPRFFSSLLEAAEPNLRPSERGAHSRQRPAAARLWSSYPSLHSPACAPLLHGCASARHHCARIGWLWRAPFCECVIVISHGATRRCGSLTPTLGSERNGVGSTDVARGNSKV